MKQGCFEMKCRYRSVGHTDAHTCTATSLDPETTRGQASICGQEGSGSQTFFLRGNCLAGPLLSPETAAHRGNNHQTRQAWDVERW